MLPRAWWRWTFCRFCNGIKSPRVGHGVGQQLRAKTCLCFAVPHPRVTAGEDEGNNGPAPVRSVVQQKRARFVLRSTGCGEARKACG